MDSKTLVEKEISWLTFNGRVLQEAANVDVPVLQRLRYLGIYSNNLDEFFRVRVADVSRLAEFSSSKSRRDHFKNLLATIQKQAFTFQTMFNHTYDDVIKTLRKRKIYLVNEDQLDKNQQISVEGLFEQKVLPELHPVLLDNYTDLPDIEDGSIYLAIKIESAGKIHFSIMLIPTDRLGRFFKIHSGKNKNRKVFIVLENIIRHNLVKIFRGVIPIDQVTAYTFKLTRDAELEFDSEMTQSVINKMAKSLKRRRHGDPERLVYDAAMPKDLLHFLCDQLKLDKYDSIMPGGRYHNAKDFMSFPSVGPSYLDIKPLPKVPIRVLDRAVNIFSAIQQQDILLYFPYHSFSYITLLLNTAALDPTVTKININLYRVAKNSRIIDALINAKKNNKVVTAVVELQARFDEAANIQWANQLIDHGVNVLFGVSGLKVHSKLISIEKREQGVLKYYSHIGTGNFNEKTAKVYTDLSILTYHQGVGKEIAQVFDFIAFNFKRYDYQFLLVSPYNNRQNITSLIEKEISFAEKGYAAEINIKINNLVDKKIINALYKASNSGVKIRIICRGMCSLVPKVKGLSENIEVISIVDRFLEHARFLIFHHGGDRKMFISSADLMTRNLDRRVEVAAPVLSDYLQNQIQSFFEIQWYDNSKARSIDGSEQNNIRKSHCNAKVRSQLRILDYLKTNKLPVAIKHSINRWKKQLKKEALHRKKHTYKKNK